MSCGVIYPRGREYDLRRKGRKQNVLEMFFLNQGRESVFFIEWVIMYIREKVRNVCDLKKR